MTNFNMASTGKVWIQPATIVRDVKHIVPGEAFSLM